MLDNLRKNKKDEEKQWKKQKKTRAAPRRSTRRRVSNLTQMLSVRSSTSPTNVINCLRNFWWLLKHLHSYIVRKSKGPQVYPYTTLHHITQEGICEKELGASCRKLWKMLNILFVSDFLPTPLHVQLAQGAHVTLHLHDYDSFLYTISGGGPSNFAFRCVDEDNMRIKCTSLALGSAPFAWSR